MAHKSNIFWCTGMSGVGKSTLVEYTKNKLLEQGYTVMILDGDAVREKYKVKLGFGREDVKKNNYYVAKLWEEYRDNYDVIMVPIISPIDNVRRKVKRILSPNYNLVYIYADIESLKKRDKKGLYKKSDNGEINDLIGYSYTNPYDIPEDYDLIIDTSKESDLEKSKQLFERFVMSKAVKSTVLLKKWVITSLVKMLWILMI